VTPNRHEALAGPTGPFTRAWAVGTAELAGVAFATTAVSLLGAGTFNVLTVSWPTLLGTAAGAAVLSVLKSIASAPLGDPGTNFLTPGGR
jgi:hypothetical protein